MRVHPANENRLLQIEGVGRLSATVSCVTVDWFNPETGIGKSITFDDAQVKQFQANDSQQKFHIWGRDYTPDFVYIENDSTLG
jgi:hypothetical protein